MIWRDALALGRVSNLPTVWTNALAGIVLVGGSLIDPRTLPLLLALSLLYVAGMYLNDWFDRGIDARERPERPIPAGRVAAGTVLAAGLGMIAVALAVLAWLGLGFREGTGPRPLAAGAALAGAIVLYDAWHKHNPLSPLVMGMCRMLVYLTAGVTFAASPPGALLLMSLVALCYLIGLTYVAKQETLGEVKNLWPLLFLAVPLVYGGTIAFEGPVQAILLLLFVVWTGVALFFLWRRQAGDVPRAVISLIAGISLLDALIIAGAGAPALAWLAVAGFALTLGLQRWIAGT
jgi:hypothetical protein